MADWTTMTDEELAREYINNYSPDLQRYMEARQKAKAAPAGTVPELSETERGLLAALAADAAANVPVGFTRDPLTGGWIKDSPNQAMAPAPEPGIGGGETAAALADIIRRRKEAEQPSAMGMELLSKMPQTIRLSGGSRTVQVTPGAYSPETASALAATYRKQAEASAKAAGVPTPSEEADAARTAGAADWVADKLGVQDKLVKAREWASKNIPAPPPPPDSELGIIAAKRAKIEEFAKTMDTWSKRNAMELERADFERDKRARDLRLSEENLRKAEEAVRNAEIDPGRYWSGLGGFFRAIGHTVANAFGAYAQGLSGGRVPNTAVDIMNRAIDRDIDAQKTNLNKLMAARGYAKETRDFVTGRFDAAMSERKALMLREEQLEIAKRTNDILGLDMAKEGIDVRRKAAETINDLERKALLALEAAKPKKTVSTTGTSREIVNPMMEKVAALMSKKPAAGEKPPAEAGKDLRANLSTLNDIDDLTSKMAKHPNRFETIRKLTTEGDEFNRQLLYTVQKWRKAVTGAAFTEKEAQDYIKQMGSNWMNMTDPWGGAVNFLRNTMRRDMANDSVRILQQYPSYSGSLLPSDLKRLSVPTGTQYVGEPLK